MVFGILAVFPVGLLIDHIFFELPAYNPNSITEYIYLVLGVPILILNYWAWFEPEVIELPFFGREKKQVTLDTNESQT